MYKFLQNYTIVQKLALSLNRTKTPELLQAVTGVCFKIGMVYHFIPYGGYINLRNPISLPDMISTVTTRNIRLRAAIMTKPTPAWAAI